jgi:cytochrome b subunit of formate dehydrogenase
VGADVLRPALLAAALGLGLVGQAAAQLGGSCERCHASREYLLQAASDRNVGANLVVTRSTLSGGPHANVACVACHTGVTFFPHEPQAARRVVCGRCHAAQDSLWRAGVHGPQAGAPRAVVPGQGGGSAGGAKDADVSTSVPSGAGCVDCHGGHAVARSGFLPTAAGRLAMRQACARCHPVQVASAEQGVHADTIPCTRCHGSHDMRPVPDVATRRIDVRLARACAACHTKEGASYFADVHGRTAVRQALGRLPITGDTAATCISCHGEHGIRRANDPTWRFAVADACTRCHAEYGSTYRDSYHGQASRVGSTRAAQCADCHTPHNVRPASDTASSVTPAHQIRTCRQCHSEARGKFAGYQPHANPRNPRQNPVLFYVWAFMTAVLTGTMVVWGAHTLLWYRRTSIDRRRREAQAGAEMAVAAGGAGEEAHGSPGVGPTPMDAALRGGGPVVWRFNLYFRVIHALIIATFFVLVVTGLPLRFSCTVWAPGLMRILGGATQAGVLHRAAGLMVFGYFAMYAAYVTWRGWRDPRAVRGWFGPDSIILQPQDARDAFAMVKWFFGRGPQPRFGRYSYMEKFDYFAELWGVGAIGFTGLMLWQPEFFALVFPGILFNVAIIIHSYEAMIATAFIFTIHFFNVHLRPDKFPLDAVMFTGRATVPYMEEEHPRIAETLWRNVAAGEPSRRAVVDAPAPPPPRWMNVVGAWGGMILLGIGLVLIGLILWGSLC